MFHFCTIITANYFPYAQQLYHSLEESFNGDIALHIFVSDKDEFTGKENEDQNLHFYTTKDFTTELAFSIHKRYAAENMDAYRWSMKSVFMKHILNITHIEKLIWLDCDIHFVGKADFLFDLLDEHRFLLTPHRRCATQPDADRVNFELNFIEGIYNAGFIGVRKDASDILDFWANCCLAACEKNPEKGFYVDQKYLDILPSRFKGISPVWHKGCNLAGWNRIECPRTIDESGKLKIDGIYDPIFVHFTPGTIDGIRKGKDGLILPYYNQYNNLLKKYSKGRIDLERSEPEKEPIQKDPEKQSFLFRLKKRFRLRTRLNAFIKG